MHNKSVKYLHNQTRSINKFLYKTLISFSIGMVSSHIIRRAKRCNVVEIWSVSYWLDAQLFFGFQESGCVV